MDVLFLSAPGGSVIHLHVWLLCYMEKNIKSADSFENSKDQMLHKALTLGRGIINVY